MNRDLFKEFDEVSAKQWKQKIQFDLKGADYNETLIWKSPDGVDVKPFYHPDETPAPIPVKTPSKWDICEKIYVASVEKSNKKAREVLQKGAESLWFIIPSEEIDPKMLFLDIDLEKVLIYLDFEFLSPAFFSKLKAYLSGKKHLVHLNLDIIGKLARSGNWFHNLNEDHRLLKEILTDSEGFSTVLSIDASLYQNAGANIPQQLAYSLAHANEYLNYFEDS
ncbi:MAG TPA: methylmalonyl-CoA mutase family protein, partial [Salinimicrobium sp.]|nr:methylmalonyl-CoA mutase family protein [Salinimicrobium sp.]